MELEIHQGESIAIMGPSGSGKSTLLHGLGCLYLPSKGRYHFNGQLISSLSDHHLAILRSTLIGFVFQSFNLIPQLNILENLAIPFLYQPAPPEKMEIQRRILSAIDCVGLSHRAEHLPAQLSGGEIQRAAIARAVAIQPLLILADEPTGNLDRRTGEGILDLFKEMNRKGTTLIIVTHSDEVGKECERIIRMEDGCIRPH